MQVIEAPPSLAEDLFESALDRVPKRLFRIAGRASIESAVRVSLNKCIDRTQDLVFAESIRSACPVDGLKFEDYLYKVIDFGNYRVGIISLRFLGGAVEHPFLHIEHANFPVIAAKPQFLQLVHELYPPLNIKRLRVVLQPEEATGLEEDLGYYIGSIPHISRQPPPVNYDRVEIVRPKDLSMYLMFNEAYESLPEEIRSLVWIESEETLEVCLKNGMLFDVRIDGEWAGLLATRREPGPYWDGVCVVEEVLSEAHRGRGFGKAAQRRLIEELRIMGETLLWGTISPKNAPSIGVATGNGRDKLCAMYWIDL